MRSQYLNETLYAQTKKQSECMKKTENKGRGGTAGTGWHKQVKGTLVPRTEWEPQLSGSLYRSPDYDSGPSNYSTGTKEAKDVFLSHYYGGKKDGMCLSKIT